MKSTLKVLDLFSGIGGFALGLKRAGGFETVAYCEIDPYCQGILRARMQDGMLDTAPICTDIRKLDGKPWARKVDLVCGGFPCQDISSAGRRAGISGPRSGLWREMHRIICDVRPQLVFVENVSALLVRGLDRVLGDLATCGYDAEWQCLPASAFGAPHRRDRVWILAYPCGSYGTVKPGEQQEAWPAIFGAGSEGKLGHADSQRFADIQGGPEIPECPRFRAASCPSWWDAEPAVGRVANGVPKRVDRLTALGNSVVPQVVEWIGRRIVNATSADSSKE